MNQLIKNPSVTMQIEEHDAAMTEEIAQTISKLVNIFWQHGGMKKWDDILKLAPDKNFNQWISAYLMDLIDRAEIKLDINDFLK